MAILLAGADICGEQSVELMPHSEESTARPQIAIED